MAEVGNASSEHAATDPSADPWLVHSDGPIAVRLFDRRAGGDPDLIALAPQLQGTSIHRMHQVHGGDVHVVDPTNLREAPASADGLLATGTAVSLVVRTADCVPVLLWDEQAQVVAAIHSGWRGLVAGVVPAAVEAMIEAGAQRERVRGWIGPSICASCYPVGADVQAQIVSAVPAAKAVARNGEPAADVVAGVVQQLAALGLRSPVRDGRCTKESPELFSARGGDATDRLHFVVTMP